MGQSSPVAMLLKPQNCWHDKCVGANYSQADDDPYHFLMVAGVQQSTCLADGLEWQGWRACVGGARITEESRQQRKYLQGAEENLLPPMKAFPKKEPSLFPLLPSDSTPAPGSKALGGSLATRD